MTDVTAGAGGGFNMPSRGAMGNLLNRPDLFLAIGVMGILVVLIFPLPALLLDLLLALSIILSVLVLMTALFIEEPLEFSAFPTVLLIVTMFRLALNLASTRLILAHGHEGSAAAGHVIEAFGNFVMGGNFVIGVIVFTILIIVNFVVITKGSGRIAEVAARFALDAMPGKQMAIDADLSAGLIDQDVAKARRKALEDEANFFGSMDGASKFVRGDAIAGLLITFINVLGGIIIGVAQQGMSFGDAAHNYTAADRRRRPRQPDSGADRLDGGGPARLEVGRARRGRQGARQAALGLSEGARHVGGGDAADRGAARHPDAALPGCSPAARPGSRAISASSPRRGRPRSRRRPQAASPLAGRRHAEGGDAQRPAQARRAQDRDRLRAAAAGQCGRRGRTG